jgi:hypothetical protein
LSDFDYGYHGSKKLHYNKLLLKSNNKPKTAWNIVKTITNNKNIINTISTMNINDKLSSNPLAITNAFNSYFSSVAENLIIINFSGKNTTNNNNDPITYLWQNLSQLSSSIKLNTTTTTHEIDKIIHSLKCKDSYGYDEISSRILKISALYVLSPQTYIFNKVLSKSIFPERLKFSEVRPLFKKGDITEFSNYSPISLLTSFSKIIVFFLCTFSHVIWYYFFGQFTP